jgi:hypothetical protein
MVIGVEEDPSLATQPMWCSFFAPMEVGGALVDSMQEMDDVSKNLQQCEKVHESWLHVITHQLEICKLSYSIKGW